MSLPNFRRVSNLVSDEAIEPVENQRKQVVKQEEFVLSEESRKIYEKAFQILSNYVGFDVNLDHNFYQLNNIQHDFEKYYDVVTYPFQLTLIYVFMISNMLFSSVGIFSLKSIIRTLPNYLVAQNSIFKDYLQQILFLKLWHVKDFEIELNIKEDQNFLCLINKNDDFYISISSKVLCCHLFDELINESTYFDFKPNSSHLYVINASNFLIAKRFSFLCSYDDITSEKTDIIQRSTFLIDAQKKLLFEIDFEILLQHFPDTMRCKPDSISFNWLNQAEEEELLRRFNLAFNKNNLKFAYNF